MNSQQQPTDPAQQTALQIAGLGGKLIQGVGQGIGWGANEIQQALEALTHGGKAQAQTSSVVPQATTTLTPTPTAQQWYHDPTVSKQVLGDDGKLHSITPTPTTMQMATQQLSGINPDVSQNFTQMLNQHIFPVTRQYGIPDAVVAAQAAQESGYMQKPAGAYNFFGLKSNSHPGFASFQTPEQAATYYAQTIKALVPNLDKIKDKPLAVMQALQGHGKTGNYEGDNPDPMQYVYDVTNNSAWKAFNGGGNITKNPHGWKK